MRKSLRSWGDSAPGHRMMTRIISPSREGEASNEIEAVHRPVYLWRPHRARLVDRHQSGHDGRIGAGCGGGASTGGSGWTWAGSTARRPGRRARKRGPRDPRSAGGRSAAGRGPVLVEELLQGSGELARQALLPLQRAAPVVRDVGSAAHRAEAARV